MRISDWSSDVCSSDLATQLVERVGDHEVDERVAKELQTLVVDRADAAMRQRLLQQFRLGETIAQTAFELMRGAGQDCTLGRGTSSAKDRKSTRLNSSH